MSVSMIPTTLAGLEANAWASMVVKVDFPTPPLPERMSILCLMPESRALMRGISGSGPFGADSQIVWLGHPAQASPLPARLDSGPGQCSFSHVSSFLRVVGGDNARGAYRAQVQ